MRVIHITPLRSLNPDLLRRVKYYTTRFGLKVKVRHGDISGYERHKIVGDLPDVLINTPETFEILLTSRSFMNNLKIVKYAVVDELHDLLGNKRGVQLTLQISRLAKLVESNQVLESLQVGFSVYGIQ